MKIWVDDIREPPDDSWVWVKNFDQFKRQIMIVHGYYKLPVDVISFDHDSGEDSFSGYDCIKWLANHYLSAWPKIVDVHSMNPVGAENIRQYADFIGRKIL